MGDIKKPKLTVEQQIDHLESKGVRFEIASKQDALEYLTKNNNYFKLTAYRKNFPKRADGTYIDLDFAMLIDLAIIDMRLRYALLHLALDVEHYAKVKLIKAITDSVEDGYAVVENFLQSLSTDKKTAFEREIDRNRDGLYCGGIIQKYNGSYPVWAFVEVIPFGRFVSFYKFCADFYADSSLTEDYYLLLSVKELRNAAAHSNCIINDLSPKTSKHPANYNVQRALARIPDKSFSKGTRRKRMSNARIQQIVSLLYAHTSFVTSEGVHIHQCEALHNVVERLFKHKIYYASNNMILASFEFVKFAVDNWFPFAYNQ